MTSSSKINNISEYQSSKILFIRNVFIKDCILMDDLMEQKLMDEANEMSETKMQINVVKLPSIFTSLSTWPQKTEILCWHCDRSFSDIPVFVPKTMDLDSTGSYTMNGEGCFCSFNCAMAYILTYYTRQHEKTNKIGMLRILFKEFYGKHPNDILPSPPRYNMIQYNGTLSPKEYCQQIKDLQKKSGIVLKKAILDC